MLFPNKMTITILLSKRAIISTITFTHFCRVLLLMPPNMAIELFFSFVHKKNEVHIKRFFSGTLLVIQNYTQSIPMQLHKRQGQHQTAHITFYENFFYPHHWGMIHDFLTNVYHLFDHSDFIKWQLWSTKIGFWNKI